MNIFEKLKNIDVPILTPQEEERTFFRIRGRVEEEAVRYNQAGMASGWIKVGGKKYEVDRPSFYVERDHSWGLRRDGVPEIGVQLPDIPEGYIYSWAIMQFPTWGAAYHIRELADGTQLLSSGEIFYSYGSQKEALKVNRIEHDF